MEMPGLGGVGVVSEHGQGGGFSRDTGARICPCSPPPLGGGCCWWWCGFRGCWLQSAVLALCIHCRVLSVQGGWFFFLLPRGKRKGRRARKGGDEVWALALAGGVGAGAWFTRRVREDRVRGSAGGGRCGAAGGANTGCRRARAGVRGLPTCRLANLSACRFVGKLASAGSAGGGWRWSGRVPRRVREDRGAGCRWCGRGDCRVQCLHCAFIAE